MLEHRFNHDVCLREKDQTVASRRWPLLTSLLVDPKLTKAFLQYEQTAKRHKRLVQWSGTISVVLAVVSLLGAGAHLAGDRWAVQNGAVLGLAAVASFLTAFLASRYWRWRRRWMVGRFAAEIVRQQHFANLLDEVATTPATDAAGHPAAVTHRGSLTAVIEDLDRSAAARMAACVSAIGPKHRHRHHASVRQRMGVCIDLSIVVLCGASPVSARRLVYISPRVIRVVRADKVAEALKQRR